MKSSINVLKSIIPNTLTVLSGLRRYGYENMLMIQDGRVDIQEKNVGCAGNGNMNAGRSNKNKIATVGNGMVQHIEANDQIIQRDQQTKSNSGKSNFQCYNCNVKGHYARNCPPPKVCGTKYFQEHMLLAMKDEAGGNLNEEVNDFMLDNRYGDGDDLLEELNVAVTMMACIQPTNDKVDAEPTSNVNSFGEVNAS
nr:hypothetical protein [Tanacetum cinerariifolium]